MTMDVGSIAVTEAVFGSRAADSANMPPPQPMSRYLSFCDVSVVATVEGTELLQRWMKVWRRGFIRCSMRDGPWGSHHDEARAEKCDISVSETEDVGVAGGGADDVEYALLG